MKDGRVTSINCLMKTNRIKITKTKEGLRETRLIKVVRPYDTPIEVWKCLDDRGIEWVT